ncbi:hypothetical protein E4T38_07253 [Aureobasidium subglaciale]|nr:hypothetical protein E4T38_07253 [Aureobasidium subglaciale]KAI5217785.1 hypothetical protein E4T40_07264 [Aureobasidium subglaciale]KAI5220707.1 hypothetical protein E4T41_07418 [Aureobasidium subglaciale]KAI5258401.1 hypothetical protein E4T46_07395 [Aureobasidium subglaciale]
MSNSTNITKNPADAACSVPACNDFPSTLANCCGRENSELQYFNTTIGPYASCALVDSNDTEAYDSYQSCLAKEEIPYFKCNSQQNYGGISDGCGLGIGAAPINNTDWPNQQTCSLPYSVNATRAFKQCCSNYNDGDGIVVYNGGCNVGCMSNSTNGTFSDCIRDDFRNHPSYICTANDGRENTNTSAGTQMSPSVAGIFTAFLLGASMLTL